jgi:hypothetical protein
MRMLIVSLVFQSSRVAFQAASGDVEDVFIAVLFSHFGWRMAAITGELNKVCGVAGCAGDFSLATVI